MKRFAAYALTLPVFSKGHNMKKVFVIALVLIMTLSFFPVSAYANDAMIVGGTGGTVYAISNSDVVMEQEIIDIVVKDGCSYVSCQFFFHNTGGETTLMMGFPTGEREYENTDDEDDEYEGPDDEYITDLNEFRTYVRGKRVPVSIKSGLEPEGNNTDELYYPQWYTWKVTFAADERVKVENRYWAVNSSSIAHDWEEIVYILRSGATWKGTIGKITIRMRFKGYNPAGVSFEEMQPTYIEEDGTIVWEAENLEPQEDISVLYDEEQYWYWEGLENPYDWDDPEYDAYERMGERMLIDARYYNGTTWWGNKFLRRFGDKQSDHFYYLMGVSYYKLGKYEKAIEMLEKMQDETNRFRDPSFYYRARAYSKIGDEKGFASYVEYLSSSEYEWLKLWAQSRLKDMEAQVGGNA